MYIVAGANGFVGASVCRSLADEGREVTLLVHRRADHPFLEERAGRLVYGDVCFPETYRNLLDEKSIVINCAGYVSFSREDREETWRVNVEGTRRLLDACEKAKVKTVLHVSAGASYKTVSTKQGLISEESEFVDEKGNDYARSKKEAETLCADAAARGLRVLIVNPATTYGAGDYRLKAGGRVVDEVVRRRARVAPPGGTSWIDIDDLVEGIKRVIEKGRSGESYILSGGNLTYRELFSVIAEETGLIAPKIEIPGQLEGAIVAIATLADSVAKKMKVGRSISPEQIGETFRYKWYSSDRAKRDVGFSARTDFSESVRRTIEFSKKYGLGIFSF